MERFEEIYHSPLGDLTIAANEKGICRIGFGDYSNRDNTIGVKAKSHVESAIRWFDTYFGGGAPDVVPPLDLECTGFRRLVYDELLKVEYGKRVSYGELARRVGQRLGKRMSAQAIGNAMKNNPIVLIIPCHRVVGANGEMTGYAAGLWRKEWLLNFESQQ